MTAVPSRHSDEPTIGSNCVQSASSAEGQRANGRSAASAESRAMDTACWIHTAVKSAWSPADRMRPI